MSLQLIQLAFALKKSFSCSFSHKDKEHGVLIRHQPTIDIPIRVGELNKNKPVIKNPESKIISDKKKLSLYFVIDLPAWRSYGPKGGDNILEVLKNTRMAFRRYKLTTNNKMQLKIDKSESLVSLLIDKPLTAGFRPFFSRIVDQEFQNSVAIGIKTVSENQIQGTKSLKKTVQEFRKLLRIDDKDDSEEYIFKFYFVFDVSHSECDCVSEFELITNGFVISFGEDGCTVKISRFLPPE
ncbi:hypothetical protein CDIK_2997, partial [Cucumispora dikerogammari]